MGRNGTWAEGGNVLLEDGNWMVVLAKQPLF
jgi:hypothetical protein